MTHREPGVPGRDDGDEDLRALLRAVGPRPQPPEDVAAEVRAAVAAEWRATVARRPRRGVVPWLAAASFAALAVTAWWTVGPPGSPAVVATVARVSGQVEVRGDKAPAWRALAAGDTVHAAETLRSADDGRLALRRADGLELRLAGATTLSIAGIDHARLAQGRLYVDAGHGRGAATDAFAVATALATVRHVGTQYAVEAGPDTVAVAVREGAVMIEHGRDRASAAAGERLTLKQDGHVSREALAPQDDAWAWAQAIAPPFEIDGRTLDEFLAWTARETGRRLLYDSPEAARAAEQLVLKGSVGELAPERALEAVLMTTPTLRHRLAGGQLRVERAGVAASTP